MKQALIIIAVVATVALIGGVIGWQLKRVDKNLGLAPGFFVNTVGDVYGTKTGTTTVGADFSVNAKVAGQSATTTYPTKLGNTYVQVIYTNKIIAASSTSNLHFSFLGSNDYGCATSTANPPIDSDYSVDMPKPTDINWFDIGDHLLNKVHSTSVANGTSTQVWDNPIVGSGRVFILNDVNYECVALQVSGSSTNAWGQIKIK